MRSTALICLLAALAVGCDDAPEAPDPAPLPDGAIDATTPRDAGVDLGRPPGDARPDSAVDDGAVALDAGADGLALDMALPEVDMALPEVDVALPDMLPPDMQPPDDPDMAPPEPVEGPANYPAGQTQSPITPAVAESLRAIAARVPRQGDVFSKIGASSTVSQSFMQCFAGDDIALDGRDHLLDTIEHFAAGDAGGSDPYTRESLSATVGWSALSAIAGDPSPLQREVDAADPRFAIVMYGTNDIQRRDIDGYAGDLLTIVETLTAQGVIPLLSSIMPRDDDPEADLLVPSYNAVVRGVAQGHQVPFIDFHRELLPLPDHGLSGDRLHPSVYRPAGARACDFGPEGLGYGYNIRNLITITALDRARAILDGEPAPDPPQPLAVQAGTFDDPHPITALPYTHLADTRDAGQDLVDGYPACDAGQDESGPERVYRLVLDRPTIIRAWVLDRGDVDVDLHLLGDRDAASCLDRDHREIVASLDPGEWWLVADTFVSAGGAERAGEYLLVVVEHQ